MDMIWEGLEEFFRSSNIGVFFFLIVKVKEEKYFLFVLFYYKYYISILVLWDWVFFYKVWEGSF